MISVTPTGDTLGATVEGVDLNLPLDDAAFATILRALGEQHFDTFEIDHTAGGRRPANQISPAGEIYLIHVEHDAREVAAKARRRCAAGADRLDELRQQTPKTRLEADKDFWEAKRAAEERKTEMESIKAELEQECADKDAEIAELKAETNTKDTEIGELKVTCDEREQLIVRLDGGL